MSWFVDTLKQYPEIAVFLALGIGYWVGGKSYKGFALGSVTATLLAAIAIGQLGIVISGNVKSVFFLMFLFAIGYGVGPQFVRGIAKDGVPQAIFAVVMCLYCLGACFGVAKLAGYDVGSGAGLFAGSQTISASMGLATDAINRIGLPADQAKALLDAMPTAYAVTYIFGTVGSAIILAQFGPLLLGINLKKACAEYEAQHGGQKELGGLGDAWRKYEVRAYELAAEGAAVGKTVGQFEAMVPTESRMYVTRVRHDGSVVEATQDYVLTVGDRVAVIGPREQLVSLLGKPSKEIDDPQLISSSVGGVNVYVSNKDADGKTLDELGRLPGARGIYIRSITRGATQTQIPILPDTTLNIGDVVTLVGRTQDISAAAKRIGVIEQQGDASDVAFIGLAITIGALIGAIVIKAGGVPITLSTAGGALIAGIFFGWFRATRPTFGRIPGPALWFMNSVGLNVFIACVGLTAGPKFISGLQHLGISLFLWGLVATAVPLFLGMFTAKYIFRFHPAILLGACAGARTTTAALGMITDAAGSQVPGLGYTVTYAVGNTLLTIWGMIIVLLLQ